jgi:hypothetical protein
MAILAALDTARFWRPSSICRHEHRGDHRRDGHVQPGTARLILGLPHRLLEGGEVVAVL